MGHDEFVRSTKRGSRSTVRWPSIRADDATRRTYFGFHFSMRAILEIIGRRGYQGLIYPVDGTIGAAGSLPTIPL